MESQTLQQQRQGHKARQRQRKKLRQRALAARVLLQACSINKDNENGRKSAGDLNNNTVDAVECGDAALVGALETAAAREALETLYTDGLCLPPSRFSAQASSEDPLLVDFCDPLASLNWDILHAAVDPARGGGAGMLASSLRGPQSIVSGRPLRKRQQIESFAALLGPLLHALDVSRRQERGINSGHCDDILPPLRVCDMGSGSGNFSLALAALFPSVRWTLVDRNALSIATAQQRAAEASLANADRFLVCAIDDVPQDEPFDICIAMHACGPATDAALRLSRARGVPYVVCPCCIGKLKEEANVGTFPRSHWLRDLGVGPDDFLALAAAADHATESKGQEGTASELCPAKCLVEFDRNFCSSEEFGFLTLIGRLAPLSCSPKNDVLVGLPSSPQNVLVHATLTRHSHSRAFGTEVRPLSCEGLAAASPSDLPRSSDSPFRLLSGHATATPVHSGMARPARSSDAVGCAFFVRRKDRLCRLMAAAGSSLCSQHQPDALMRERHRVAREVALARPPGNIAEDNLEANSKASFHPIPRPAIVNPFSNVISGRAVADFVPPNWTDVFDDPTLPLLIDFGCGAGRCIRFLSLNPGHIGKWNFLGVEIVASQVEEANNFLQTEKSQSSDGDSTRRNCYFVCANALDRGSMDILFNSLLAAAGGIPVVSAVCIQFSDPWTRSRHRRRRLVGSCIAETLVSHPSVRRPMWVYVSSDVESIVVDAQRVLTGYGFEHVRGGDGLETLRAWDDKLPICDADGLLGFNPLGNDAPSERESVCEMLWRKVFRTLMVLKLLASENLANADTVEIAIDPREQKNKDAA